MNLLYGGIFVELICPACRKIFLKTQVDTQTRLEIDVCPRCYGIWFDGSELSRFLQSDELKRKFYLAEDVAPARPEGASVSAQARNCPRCRKPMEEKRFADVAVDVCETCKGLWLDDGEIRQIVDRYQKGSRGDKTVSSELSAGLEDKKERPSFRDLIEGILKLGGKG